MNVATRATQTSALVLDAYRELNSKKLFWVTLVISLCVVLSCAALGINAKGITVLGWEFDTAPLTADLVPPAKFYLFLFANLAVPIWLTWLASLLALISTASIVPDFLAGGAIELTLARPLSRLRLFATKYACGLLFVALQVSVFSVACFVVVGLRGGSWEPRIFLALPIVVLFFSYLFAFCVLFGMLTRSTIASLLLTLLVWMGLWALNTTSAMLLMLRETAVVNAERAARRVERHEESGRRKVVRLEERDEPVPGSAGAPLPGAAADALEAVEPALHEARAEAQRAMESAARWRRAAAVATAVKAVLPKTDETIALLDRWTLTAADKRPFEGGLDQPPPDDGPLPFGVPDGEAAARFNAVIRGRSAGWVIGTSCLCEAVVFALAAWLFCRRDF